MIKYKKNSKGNKIQGKYISRPCGGEAEMGQSNPLANKSANIVRDMARLNIALDISSNLRPLKITGKTIGHFQCSEISRWSILVAQGTISFLKEEEVVCPVIVMQFSPFQRKRECEG